MSGSVNGIPTTPEVKEAVGTNGPSSTPEDPPQPKAWQVGYADLGTFSMIGTSQKSVAGVVMHLRSKYRLLPDTLVQIDVLDMRGKEGITWVFPALITGVFNKTPDLQRRGNPGGFAEALDELMGRNGIPKGINVAVVEPGENEDGH